MVAACLLSHFIGRNYRLLLMHMWLLRIIHFTASIFSIFVHCLPWHISQYVALPYLQSPASQQMYVQVLAAPLHPLQKPALIPATAWEACSPLSLLIFYKLTTFFTSWQLLFSISHWIHAWCWESVFIAVSHLHSGNHPPYMSLSSDVSCAVQI